MSKLSKDELTGQCMKCKDQRTMVSAKVQKKSNRYSLIGGCEVCGTKMHKFLGKDSRLAQMYRSAMGTKEGAVSIQNSGEQATPDQPEVEEVPDPPKKGKRGKKGRSKVTTVKKTAAKKSTRRKSKKAATKTKRVAVSTADAPIKVTYPLAIFFPYKGKTYTGTMLGLENPEIKVRGQGRTVFSSPTLAAGTITGTKVNGWKSWKFEHGDKVYHIDALRSADQRGRRASSGPSKSLVGYSDEYPDTYTLPLSRLPVRGAAYFVDKKTVRFGHLTMVALLTGETGEKSLVAVRFKKNGSRAVKGKKLGVYNTWKDAAPDINAYAEKNNLHRVKVQKAE